MSTPSMVEAQARLDEAKRAATTATANVALTRERVAIREASDADLRRVVRTEQKAIDNIATAEAGLRVAQRVAQAQEAENRRVMERVRYEQHRLANVKLGKAQVATVVVLTRHLSEMDALAKEYSEIEAVIGSTAGSFATHMAAWGVAVAAIARLRDIFEPIAARAQPKGQDQQ